MVAVLAAEPKLALPPGHPDEFVGQPITPAEQVRVLLQRKKRQGVTDWALLWPWAVGRVRWPHDREERHEWKRTIAWAEPAYRAAFDGELPVIDMAALMLADISYRRARFC
jgi:hypothetical protein